MTLDDYIQKHKWAFRSRSIGKAGVLLKLGRLVQDGKRKGLRIKIWAVEKDEEERRS